MHATLVGRFFSGLLIKYPKATFCGGYGHMGCCTLLAIQEVKSVDAQNRDDLDYGAASDQPAIESASWLRYRRIMESTREPSQQTAWVTWCMKTNTGSWHSPLQI